MSDSELTRLRRLPDKAKTDRESLNEILDSGFFAHVGVLDREQPLVVPVAHVRSGNQILIHGSKASRLFKALSEGRSATLTVTQLDGLVLARSLFESSMNYRCAMIFGKFYALEGNLERRALKEITERLLPGRWDHARQPSEQEIKATSTLAIDIDQWSVKISEGEPDDTPGDLISPDGQQLWAGVVPITQSFGEPIPDRHVPEGTPVPSYIHKWEIRAR